MESKLKEIYAAMKSRGIKPPTIGRQELVEQQIIILTSLCENNGIELSGTNSRRTRSNSKKASADA